ncbi:vacuolar protein sorting-associated protein 64 [Echria macrotheca]|uniref:Vacuolar protein sorting-associated protein 64 n=1 Tax=Echria macrotheca TaxID=438768 RepID=A0AAJ0FEF1_9PEZI|nr:vacuolar protein sorting-associated protein 64 [Echria macrotheca]
MTAVAAPPSFANLNRPGWASVGQTTNPMNADDFRGSNMFGRKTIQRTNSSSSVSSTGSTSSTSTVISTSQPNGGSAGESGAWPNATTRKRPPQSKGWANGKQVEGTEFSRNTPARPPVVNGVNGAAPSGLAQQGHVMSQNGLSRAGPEGVAPGRQPVLSLLSLNGSFDRKTISVPFYPDTLRIGRQTNAKTVPTPVNGFFDSKVLSRQHAEVWADGSGKIWIRDVKSSNGTFVNGTRLSPENRESEPHELQPQDHLELGIDIVSEDQKTVVHHKVAAKVEHAGFVSPSNNPLEMPFGDLDPSNGGMMMPVAGTPLKGRPANQASMANGGRMPPANMAGPANGMAPQRQYWMSPITTEHIVKKLHAEMRNARLQHQDLARTSQFIDALLTKEDLKTQDKPEAPEPPKTQITNGNISFRSDGGKTRFSEPPAPPPSQPLPEKPDISRPSEIPSLKRGTTERPKSHPSNTSPIRPDNSLNQIMQLTEALANTKKELDSYTARVRDLEETLNKEREARQLAEDMMQKMEESAHAMNGSAAAPVVNGHSELEQAFDSPAERPATPEPTEPVESPKQSSPQPDKIEALAAMFQARIDTMASEMTGLREQLEAFRMRAEKAEAERDADRKTLAEMVEQIRLRDEKDREAAERKARSPSRRRSRPASRGKEVEVLPVQNGTATKPAGEEEAPAEEPAEAPTLSRANTITPASSKLATSTPDAAIIQTLPYASMIGVVLFGMGLMAYLNGWQPQSKLEG